MIPAGIRYDDAWRRFPAWGVVLILNAGVFTGLLTTIALGRRESVSPIAMVLLGWFTFALYLGVGAGRSRCRAFDLALPISARRIWLAHLAAIALAGTILVASCVAMAALPSSLGGGPDPRAPGLGGLALLLESGMLLAAVLLQRPAPSLARIPVTPGNVAWDAAVLFGVLGLMIALGSSGPAVALLLLLLAGAALAWGYRSVPRAFVIVPRNGGSAARAVAGVHYPEKAGSAPGRLDWRDWLAILRCLSCGAKELAAYPFIVGFGLFLGGALSIWKDEADLRDLRYVYIPLATYMLFSFVLPRLARLQGLDPLPLSRRRLFAGLVLPGALVFLTAWSFGALVEARYGVRTELVDFVQDEKKGSWSVRVPLGLHEFAWDGRVPDVTSPWGESHPAERTPLFRGSRAAIGSPYDAPAGSSAGFVALQLSRAAEAAYGLSLPPGEIERRWLEARPDGTVAGRYKSLPIRAEHPGLFPRTGPVVPVLMALAIVPWLLLVAALFRGYRATIPDGARKAIYWSSLALLISPMLLQVIALVAGFSRPWLLRAFFEIPLGKLAGSAAWTAAAWAAGVLLVLAAYRLAERQFRRMEIPAKPVTFSMFERMREDQG